MSRKQIDGQTDDNKRAAVVQRYVEEYLYPAEYFPRHIFLDIDHILVSHFNQAVLPAHQHLRVPERNPQALEKLAAEHLDVKSLLRDHPQILVNVYTPLIQRFLRQKIADPETQRDVYQEVVVRLLQKKLAGIYRHYRFDFDKKRLFSSYFMVTVRNIYIDIVREKSMLPNKEISLEDVRESGLVEDSPPIGRLIVEEELLKLNAILKMFYRSTAKIELCLKLKYRIRLNRREVLRSYPQCSEEEIESLSANYQQWRDHAVFKEIVPIFNRWEGKTNQGDTLRKWLDLKIEEIIGQLNRTHDRRVYNSKNFGDLLSLYYQRYGHTEKIVKGDTIGEN